MPKSFSIDLKQFTLYRPIADTGKVLKTRVDRSDVVACLNGLGYHNIDEVGITRGRYGIIPSLEDCLSGKTLGIPASATVHVRALGRHPDHLLFTFTY